MIKKLFILTFILNIFSIHVFCQDFLDIEKNKDAELFIIKKGYDVQERLKEIEQIVGKQVTVYLVTGKDNKIKQTYTGIAEMADYPKITDKSKATLITVRVKGENGTMGAYFPLTNDKKYRIYLTEKMK